jgi:hypothetical protein
VRALEAVFLTHETRLGGGADPISGNPYPKEWQPQTGQEFSDVLRSGLNLLDLALADEDEEIRVSAQSVLIHAASWWGNSSLFPDFWMRIEKLAPFGKVKQEALDVFGRILREGERSSARVENFRREAVSANGGIKSR